MLKALAAASLVLLSAATTAATTGAVPWPERLRQEALTSGFLSRLPPNVSLVLGLAKPEQGVEVRQLVSKSGKRVRTFNVGVTDHDVLVLFNIDAHSGATVAYLVTPEGKLRSAVTYQAGREALPLSAADAQHGLAAESHFWSARAHAAP